MVIHTVSVGMDTVPLSLIVITPLFISRPPYFYSVNVLPIDSIYTPIRNVKYAVEPYRVEQKPWNGVNALSITTSAIQMMGLMRETFREEDHVRLHNVIRKAGDVINSVPDEAVIETKVRAASLERIEQVMEMVNRAYAGSAYAFGGKIEREVLQGYMPILPREADEALIEAANDLGLDYRTVQKGDFNNACTDVGDLSHLLPIVNFTFKGFEGKLHGADFKITDPEKAYILPAKLLALTAYKLLRNGGEKAKEIKDSYTPFFDKDSYIQYVKKITEKKAD